MARCVARAGAGPGSVRTWRTRTRSPCSRRPSRPCPRSRGKAPTRPDRPGQTWGAAGRFGSAEGGRRLCHTRFCVPPARCPSGLGLRGSSRVRCPRLGAGGQEGTEASLHVQGWAGLCEGPRGGPVASSRSASLPSVGVSSAERLLPCGPSRWGRWSRRALFWLRRAHGPSQADLIPLPRIEAEVDRRKGGWRGSPGSGRSPGGSERSQLPSPLSLALQGPRAPSAAHVLPGTPRQLSSEAVWLRRVHARVCVGKGAPWRLPWACGAMARAV